MSLRQSIKALLRSDTAIEKQFDTVLDELACKVEQQAQEIAKLKAENTRLKGKRGVLHNATMFQGVPRLGNYWDERELSKEEANQVGLGRIPTR